MRTGCRLSAIGLAFAALAWGTPASAQYTAHSLAELRNYASTYNGATITLSETGGDPHPVTGVVRPGVYWINGDHIANPTNSEPIYLELGGNGNTYNLEGARLNLDTRKLDGFGRNLGHGSGVRVVKISGDGNTVNGLSLTGYDLELDTDPNAQRHADWAAVYVQVTGSNNNLLGADVVTRGSTPYGLGDAFGKGASGGVTPFIGHRKTSGLQVLDASNSYFDDIHLDINTFGHGFFVQKSSDTTLENSTVTGELVPSSNVINHPLYQEHGHTYWGNPIPDDIMISAAEDGVRAYGSIDGVSVTNMTVRNVVVTNMRSGFATSLAKGSVLLDSVETYGGEKGFGVGSNHTITNSKGDITNGPLIFFPYDNFKDSTIDVELVGEVPVGVDWSAAYLNGDNLDVTISSSLPTGALPAGSLVRLGQEFFEDWRNGDSPTGPDFPTASDFINSTFINNTNQMLVMGNDVTGNTGTSAAPVISNGKENYYDGITLVPAGVRTVLVHRAGLGNNGNSAEGTLETNASVVSGGGTLELASGIQIGNEKLTISGDGVDGNGALYAGGAGSRFGSSSRSDESIIVLEGSASIGVDGDLIVGSVQGVGDLTKRGSGRLSLEKSNTFIGDLIVTEGEVTVRTGGVNHGLTVSAGATVRPLGSHAYNTEGHAEIDGTLDLNGRTDENTLTQRIGSLSGVGGIISSNTAGTAFGILEISSEDTEATFQGYITGEVSVVKSGNGSQTLAPISGGLDYLGATTVNEGRLLIDGVHSGGGEFQINSGGALGGSGAILSNVTVASEGSLAPGFSAGSLSLSEAELSAGSTLEIELGGTSGGDQHDVLTTIDGLTLGGELVISLLDTGGELFIPASSDIFNIIQSGLPIAGAFANAADGQRVDTLGGEGSFLVNYDTTADSIFLSDFLIAGLTGDYNRDGVVDAADYSVWRDTLGQTGVDPFSGADGNGDGQITPADYAIWTANFGAASAPDAASSVPEPDSLLLLLITCILLKAAIGFRHSL